MNECDLNEDIHQYPIKPKLVNILDNVDEKSVKFESFNRDMAVVSCHFNWAGFNNPARNLHRFIRQMRTENIPLFGVELSLSNKFETTGIEGWKQIKVEKENIFFQKEACINLAEKIIPKKYTKIAWIDPDLFFTNRNWYREASQELDTYKVIQLYSHGIKTDKSGKMIKTSPGALFSYMNVPENKRIEWITNTRDIGYPGGAMAARRELWKHGGLYPFRVLGGGDTAFMLAMLKPRIGWPTNELFIDRHNEWKKKILAYVSGSVSYIKGEFVHEWHGDSIDRKYVDRYSILKNFNVNGIRINEIGLVHNYGDFRTNDSILRYFKNRNEDGVDEKSQRPTSEIVVYTCIVGNYDKLREISQPESGVDYVCFTDQNIESKTWKIRPIPAFLNTFESTKIARCVKILPHIFLPEYNVSVWADGNIQVLGNIVELINLNLKNYFAIPKHPDRVCVYEEGNAIIKLKKDTEDNVNNQLEIYRKNKYPVNNGMVQSNIIIRKHNDSRCITICNTWWNEVRLFSRRDQLSFNYCIWKKNVIIDIMNPNLIVSKHFQIWKHVAKGSEKSSLRKDYGDLKNYINGVEV
jgi:hypothetical protein